MCSRRAVFALMELLTEALSFGLEQRLASLRLRKADEHGVVQMTQESLANHLGTVCEVVSRLVRGLVSSGVLATSRGTIRIADEDKLVEITDA
jgi:CRP/FNR family transcriptional regulator